MHCAIGPRLSMPAKRHPTKHCSFRAPFGVERRIGGKSPSSFGSFPRSRQASGRPYTDSAAEKWDPIYINRSWSVHRAVSLGAKNTFAPLLLNIMKGDLRICKSQRCPQLSACPPNKRLVGFPPPIPRLRVVLALGQADGLVVLMELLRVMPG